MPTTCDFELSPVHQPIGTLIDGGSLKLVEVLGVGGYGIVYRAVETRSTTMTPKSYAVKCLVAPPAQNPCSRQVHIREIALHQLASRHPGVATLHRVVESLNLIYIVMDYAPDHDLFTQILQSCRYLGDDALIKQIFLQLLDAVEYCHSLGIYHRDLKPENILCYDDGLRIVITDFGLATTEKVSDEFCTGSMFHMSPECQGARFTPQGNYSPMHNDIWSLGIILLNLATGRNPWESATADDPTFQAYLRSPSTFLSSVFPISSEVNKILVGMLNVDYRRRTSLCEVRRAIQHVTTFYSDGVIFEGSMARCPRESSIEVDVNSSEDSDLSCSVTWAYESTASSSTSSTSSFSEPSLDNSDMYDGSQTLSETSFQHPVSSFPDTPDNAEIVLGPNAVMPNRNPSTIKMDTPQPHFYGYDTSINSFFEDLAIIQAAIKYDPHSSTLYLTSAISESKVIAFPTLAATESMMAGDKETTPPLAWWTNTVLSSFSPRFPQNSPTYPSLNHQYTRPSPIITTRLPEPSLREEVLGEPNLKSTISLGSGFSLACRRQHKIQPGQREYKRSRLQ